MSCDKIVRSFFEDHTIVEVSERLLLLINVIHDNPKIQNLAEHERKAMSNDLTEVISLLVKLNEVRT